MLEQVKTAFPGAENVRQHSDVCVQLQLPSVGKVHVLAPREGVSENWLCSTDVFLGDSPQGSGATLEAARNDLYRLIRESLQDFSHKVRHTLAQVTPVTIPPPSAQPPAGFPWIACGKNKWTAEVAHDTIYLRYSKSYGYFEYRTVSGFEGRFQPHESLADVLTHRVSRAVAEKQDNIKHLTKIATRLVTYKQTLEALCSTK